MSGTQISGMTALGSLPASGARVPIVKDGEKVNYLYDLAADLTARDSTGHPLSYTSPRTLKNTARQAQQKLASLHTDIVGYAAVQGCTGGLGGTKIPVIYSGSLDDTTVQYSPGWAFDQLKTLGGNAQIWFEPSNGEINVFVPAEYLINVNNWTVYAGGGNVIFWHDRLNGNIDIQGNNWIWSGIQHYPMPGPINGTVLAEVSSRSAILLNPRNDLCDNFAVMNCEFEHPSWHCLDVASATAVPSLCRFTFQNCIARNAIQSHFIGINNGTGADTDTRKIFGTIYNPIYDHCLQRNPKILAGTFIHLVNPLFILRPYEVEYIDGGTTYPEIHTDAFGASVQDGGHLLIEGGFAYTTDSSIDGMNMTELQVGTSGNTGRIKAVGCRAENGLVISERNPELVAAPPYTLAYDPVPADEAGKLTWLAARWAAAGARVDSAPPGLFKWVTGSAAKADGVKVVMDRSRGRSVGRWHRISDAPTPGTFPFTINSISALGLTSNKINWTRGSTKTIAAGVITVTSTDQHFAVDTEGAAASDDLDTISGGTTGQRITIRPSSAARTINLTTAGNISVTTAILLSNNNQFVELVYDTTWKPISLGVIPTLRLTGALLAAQFPALTGDITTAAGALATTVAANAVTYAKFQQVAASSLVGNPTGSLANAQGITLAGGLTFSGTTLTVGALTPTSVAATGTITSSGGGVGYATGAGGTVTQATSRTTGVTLNKLCGAITLFSAAGSVTWQSFTVTNSQVAANDVIRVVQQSGTDLNMIHVTNVAAGSFKISFATTGGITTEQPVFNFAVLKGVAA